MPHRIAILALSMALAGPPALAQDPGAANPAKTDRGHVEGAVVMPDRPDATGSIDGPCHKPSSQQRDASAANAAAAKRCPEDRK
jgi:hypothetical protein